MNKPITKYSQEDVSAFFEQFQTALKTFPLPDGKGGTRKAHAAEFMFMGKNGGFVEFKHNLTRNYVFMNPNLGTIQLGDGKDDFEKHDFSNDG